MVSYNVEKEHAFLKGYALAKDYKNTLNALAYARNAHRDQKRKDGQPYFIHPLTMACHATALEAVSDDLLAAILLHDVVEDCEVTLSDLPVSQETKEIVKLVTFKVENGETKEVAKNRYYNAILKNENAVIVKLIDRCHNVSSMAGTFTNDKLLAYIEETRAYVLPLLREAKTAYPQFSNIFFVLKYHIVSIIDSIEATLTANSTRKED